MARVIALVEGPTEERFVRWLVAGELGASGVFISATTSGRPRSQGGVPPWHLAEREIVRLLRENADRYVTTMFDYYGMPMNWPGREEARKRPHAEKASVVEEAMLDRIGLAKMSQECPHFANWLRRLRALAQPS